MSEINGDCRGRMCGYGVADGRVTCDSGDGSCWEARFIDADVSSFHDEHLRKATEAIREILKAIPDDPDGRKLSFVHTEFGTLLAWVDHAAGHKDGSVTIGHGHEAVAAALGLHERGKGETAA